MGTEALLERLHAQYAPVTADGDSAEAPVGAVRSRGVSHGVLVLELAREALLDTVRALRDQHGFDLFLDVTAVDWPDAPLRFEVVWHFYSTTDKVRVRLKTRVAADDAEVDSLTSLYGSAGYMERECHDMYGIRFRNHPDLRRLLLYEEFEGHPLRKDYPKERRQPLVGPRN